jgi:hypothetical protein
MAVQDPKVEDVKRSGISMAMDWGSKPTTNFNSMQSCIGRY